MNLKKVDNQTMQVNVTGIYPFANVGYKTVDMFFPIPKEVAESKNIRVWLNDEQLPWFLTEKGYVLNNGERVEFTYETLEGTFPLIMWTIPDAPEKFTIRVEYSYKVSSKEGELRTLYAMATGRFTGVYAKRCTAYVTVSLVNFQNHEFSIRLCPPPSTTAGASSFQFNVNTYEETFHVIEESSMFNGLNRDIQISTRIPVERTYEWRPYTPSNLNLKIDMQENYLVNITANILLPHGGFKLDWGGAEIVPNASKIEMDTKILEWTGPAPAIMINATNTYLVGPLKAGDYVLDFKANNLTVKTISFTVTEKNGASKNDLIEPVFYLLMVLPIAIVLMVLARKKLSL
ncbi:MAG: hypothetical protein QXJ17_07475 [Nitrososphaeria archaeon]